MLRYLAGRAAVSLSMLFVITLGLFFISQLMGDPWKILMDPPNTREYEQQRRKALGLDRPLHEQYFLFLGKAIRGEWGTSIRAKRPVSELVLQRIPKSLKLAAFSMVAGLLLAIPLGRMGGA